ncbi:MAG: hypothetical protein ABS87_06605 [Sphingomonas sp. SCN 67-18]|uniref:hypothetical protein n=1 Tax=uncultured Sphingomonas sp. TaxID=158754 RepID=UPI000869B12E|nr:hypothetical protein [Sphingomonas sp. SCN 67-18]ODU21494.1 MAG: hypothetical protein ABS87_06605 [Sphingomonas sp. SCN 67-18]
MTNDLGESARRAAERAGEKLEEAKTQVYHGAAVAKDAVGSAYTTARTKADEAIAATRTKANSTYRATRSGAARISRQAADGVEHNPLAVMIGGAALGALIGVLLPRSERETKALGSLGRKVNSTARAAAEAAKKAGKQQMDSLGLNKRAAQDQVASLVDKALSAAGTAGTAAAKSVRTRKPATRSTGKPSTKQKG